MEADEEKDNFSNNSSKSTEKRNVGTAHIFALLKKNRLISWRHKISFFCELLCPIFFVGVFAFAYTFYQSSQKDSSLEGARCVQKVPTHCGSANLRFSPSNCNSQPGCKWECKYNMWDSECRTAVCLKNGVAIGQKGLSGSNLPWSDQENQCKNDLGGDEYLKGECIDICSQQYYAYLYEKTGNDNVNWESRNGNRARTQCEGKYGDVCKMTIPADGVTYEINDAWHPEWKEFPVEQTYKYNEIARDGARVKPIPLGLGFGMGSGLRKMKNEHPWNAKQAKFDSFPGHERRCISGKIQNFEERQARGPNERLELFPATMKANDIVLALYPDNEEMRAFETWLKTAMPGLKMSSVDNAAFGHKGIDLPGMAEVVQFYDSSSAVDLAVRSAEYGKSSKNPLIAAAVTIVRSGNDVKYTIRMPNKGSNFYPAPGSAQVSLERDASAIPFNWLHMSKDLFVCEGNPQWGECADGLWLKEKLDACKIITNGKGEKSPEKLYPNYGVPSFSSIQLILDKYVINQKFIPPQGKTEAEALLQRGVCDYLNDDNQIVDENLALSTACLSSLLGAKGIYYHERIGATCKLPWTEARVCQLGTGIVANPLDPHNSIKPNCPGGNSDDPKYLSDATCEQNCFGPTSCECFQKFRRCRKTGEGTAGPCGEGEAGRFDGQQDTARRLTGSTDATTGDITSFDDLYTKWPNTVRSQADAEMAKFVGIHSYFPQSLRVIPFPTSEFKSDPFYESAIPQVMTTLFVVAFCVPVFYFISRLVFEKESKIREGMAMMGLNQSALAVSWIISYMQKFTFHAIVCAVLLTKAVFDGLFDTSWILMFMLFFLYGFNTTCFCFMISQCFDKSATASVLGAVLFFAGFIPSFIVDESWSVGMKSVVALLPPTGLSLGIDYCKAYNGKFIQVNMDTFFDQVENFSLALCFLMHLLGSTLWLVLAFYFKTVVPSEFTGTTLPFYFFLLPSYWKRKVSSTSAKVSMSIQQGSDQVSPDEIELLYGDPDFTDTDNFQRLTNQEKQLMNDGKCIHIRSMTKKFTTADGSTKVANDRLNAVMFKGEIFVLLGHNGAGKTTALSQLCGLLSPSTGDASILGYSIRREMSQIRRILGVCPQQNVLYKELTVREHMMLYAKIKLIPKEKRIDAINNVLAGVALTEKTYALTRNLSGGQKRKCCLAIALIGDSPVLMLDEPTSGMDVFAQRSTWNMLQKSKRGRIIVLTTHSMEEADVLADRIGIMSDGRMICCGTPMFLKERYGVGYSMVATAPAMVVAGGEEVARNITALVQKHVPEAKVLSNLGQEISFQLPLNAAPQFEKLFSEMSKLKKQDEQKLSDFNVSVTTVEEVFIKSAEGAHRKQASAKVAEKEDTVMVTDSKVNERNNAVPEKRKILQRKNTSVFNAEARERSTQSCSSIFHHFLAMQLKRLFWFIRDIKSVLFIVIVPIGLMVLGLYALTTKDPFSDAMIPTTLEFNPKGAGGLQSGSTAMPMIYFNPPSATGLSQESKEDREFRELVMQKATDLKKINSNQAVFSDDTIAGDPITQQVGSTCLITNTNDPSKGSSQSVCALGDDGASWSCGVKHWLLSLATSRADSIYGAWGILPSIDGLPGSLNGYQSRWLDMVLMVNSTAPFGVPLFQSIASSAMWQAFREKDQNQNVGGSITVELHPLPMTLAREAKEKQSLTFVIVFLTGLSFALVSAPVVEFLVRERYLGFKHQQLVSGVSIFAYWFTAWLWDCLLYMVPAWGTILVFNIFGDDLEAFTQVTDSHWDAIRMVLVLFGPAAIGLCYCLSFFVEKPSTSVTIVISLGIVNIVLVIIAGVLQFILDTCLYGIWIKRIFSIIPQFALPSAIFSLAMKPVLVSQYHQCITCPASLIKDGYVPGAAAGSTGYHPDLPLTCRKCNAEAGILTDCYDSSQSVSAFDEAVLLPEVRGLVIAAVCFPLLALLFDIAGSHPAFQRFFCRCFTPVVVDPEYIDDKDVTSEAKRVQDNKIGKDVVEARGLRKIFRTKNKDGKMIKKVAVKNMWFGITRGEVFGFLGVNGAGKSTVFKMLSGDHMPSVGTASMCGRDILTEQISVRRLIGYCPQHNALLPKVTVREHLRIFGLIKGVTGLKLEEEITEKLNRMDLVEFAGAAAGTLSGGNKRKLCVAIALIGSPPIIFLDEPSAGMDPVAKRFMWSLISDISTVSGETTIVMTTHSMEETSALCSRIGIMVDGRLRCLGSEQHLKNRYGKGYQLEVRLKESSIQETNHLLNQIATVVSGPNASVWQKKAQAALNEANATDDQQGSNNDKKENNLKRANSIANFNAATASLQIEKKNIEKACTLLGNTERFLSFSKPNSSSWILQESLEINNSVDAVSFLEWWWAEERVVAILNWCKKVLSPQSSLVEQHGNTLRFSLPFDGEAQPIAEVFGLLERSKTALSILDYCVGQTTLEQIFLGFAAEQSGVDSSQVKGVVSSTEDNRGEGKEISMEHMGLSNSCCFVGPNDTERGGGDGGYYRLHSPSHQSSSRPHSHSVQGEEAVNDSENSPNTNGNGRPLSSPSPSPPPVDTHLFSGAGPPIKKLDQTKSMKPLHKHRLGSHRWKIHNQLRRDLIVAEVDLRSIVKLPPLESLNEWIAVHVIDFYNEISLLYGCVEEFCTPENCPIMNAGNRYTFLWQDSDSKEFKRPVRVSAPRYVSLLLDWVEKKIMEFDGNPGSDFPDDFEKKTKQIFKRLFRVYGHLYHSHFRSFVKLEIDSHINRSFTRFTLFVLEFNLIKDRELQPLRKLLAFIQNN
eukprot:g6540.t1